MTDRARHVYALLRTLFATTPTPGSRMRSTPGFSVKNRLCLNCKTAGKWNAELRRRVDPACSFCGGTGVRPVKDAMDDPVEAPKDERRKVGWFGLSGDDAREARNRRDLEIDRLEDLAKVRAGQSANLSLFESAIVVSDRHARSGSYRELLAALEWYRLKRSVVYELAMMVAYHAWGEPSLTPSPRVMVACEVLATRMPERIRVPRHVAQFTKDELAHRSREAKAALAFGRSDWASASRAERKRLIVLLAGEGMSDGKIAARFGLSREWVQRTRKGIQDVIEESNGHEEAA